MSLTVDSGFVLCGFFPPMCDRTQVRQFSKDPGSESLTVTHAFFAAADSQGTD